MVFCNISQALTIQLVTHEDCLHTVCVIEYAGMEKTTMVSGRYGIWVPPEAEMLMQQLSPYDDVRL